MTRVHSLKASWLALAAAPLIAAACAEENDGNAPAEGPPRGSGGSGAQNPSDPGVGAGAGGAGAPGTPPPPAETEERREFEAPRAGARFVYVANSRRDTVAIIDSMGLGIRTVAVGDTPSYLATAPGKDVALVINTGTRDVNVLRTDAAASTAVSRVPIAAGLNRLSVAPDGGHAMAWYDSKLTGAGAGRAAAGSFQDVSLITLAPGADAAVGMTVGFRPTDVVFANDGRSAFVITEDGISVAGWWWCSTRAAPGPPPASA
jgi:hypothetical protein